jgi:hypothetical protein
LVNYQAKCDQVEKLEAKIDTYQSSELSPSLARVLAHSLELEAFDEQYKELEKVYNDELVESKRKMSFCVVK